MYILGNGKLITRDSAAPYFPDGAVAIQGSRILARGETAKLRADFPGADFVDAKGGVIMPGLINAHTHIYSALARGLSIRGNSPTNFLEILEGTWWNIDRRLDLDATRASAYATCLDCIKQGATSIFDHHASFGQISGSLFAISEAAEELGLRACLCYEVSDRDGTKKRDEAIAENADYIAYCAQHPSAMRAAKFGGHALFTLSDETFRKMAAANIHGTGYHIHVSEGRNDVDDSIEHYGKLPVERLKEHGILGPETILGHCIHLSEEELELIAGSGTWVVNNPESNMGNAVGCSPVLRMAAMGIPVCLGTDAYTNDMLESLKAALAIQRHNAGRPNVGWGEVTTALFGNNPKLAAQAFGVPLGILAPGAAADVIVMDYKPFTPFGGENIDGHMLFGMTGRQCQTTIINGRILMLDRQLQNIDEEALNARILVSAKKLWGQLNPEPQ